MKATNSITQQQNKPGFTATISSKSIQNMIMQTLKDPSRAANFTSTLISVVNGSEALQQCEAPSIISAALRGEALSLIYPVGEYSIVPYKNWKKGTTEAQFQISAKGILRLASRSGQYRRIILKDVREGEYKGIDPLTEEPIIDFIRDERLRNSLPLAGYFGRYILHSGFMNSIYWSHEKILDHADRYSKSFSKEKYKDLLSGKIDSKEAEKLRSGTPWYGDPLSEGHLKMCKKTIVKQLFNDGIAPLSVEMISVLKEDSETEQGGEFISADDPRITAANAPGVNDERVITPFEINNAVVVNTDTGEIVDADVVIDPKMDENGQLSLT